MPEIVILGDSHLHALERAHLRDGSPPIAEHTVWLGRFSRTKGKRMMPGVTMDEAIERVARLGPEDLLVSIVGGNEFSVVGMIQHPIPFDYVEPDMAAPVADAAQMVPCAAMDELFETHLMADALARLRALHAATVAPTIQLAPPPPKEDGGFVLSRADTLFKAGDIDALGVSPAPLRLKLWFTQMRLMRRACAAIGVVLLPPPFAALTPAGYLDPRYYGDDATHANTDYGGLVLATLAEHAALEPGDPRAS